MKSEKVLKILVLEDNEIDQELYELAFEKISANNKIEAKFLKSISEVEDFLEESSLDFDIILCDLILDDIKTFEVISRLKKINESIPILLMSSSAHEDDIINGYEEGITDFCMKPNSYKTLCDLLTKAINTYCPFIFYSWKRK